MRRLLMLTVVTALLILFVSCKADTENESNKGSNLQSDTSSAIKNKISAVKNSGSSESETSDTISTSSYSSTAGGGNIIAKSDNAVTDKQKKQLLESLEKELDNLLNDIENLDEISDSDLSISSLN